MPADGAARRALRRDHHRRQRPLGQAARVCASATATTPAPTTSRRACATRSSWASRELTVYSFSTENWSRPATEVTGADADVRRSASARDARAARGGRAACASSAAASAVPPALVRADGLGGGADRRQRADHAVRRLQLRRPRGDPRRRARASAAAARTSSAPALRARDARPGPHHPHERRAAAVELPAVAVRLLGARVPRRAVAGLHRAAFEDALAEYAARRRRFGGRVA